MKDQHKTKAQLINELSELRQQFANDEKQIIAEDKLQIFLCAVEQNPASILITDIHGTIEYVNPMFSELTGYAAEEAIGQNPRMLKSGYTSAAEYAALWKTITSGNSWDGKFCNQKKNGEYYWETISITPVLNQLGNITHFVAINEDVTDRMLTEETLEQERRLLRTVIDNIPDQIFAHDRDCNFILNNLSDARIIGVKDPADLLGKSDMDFYPAEFAARYQADDRQVMESDQLLRVENEPSVTADGQKRWVNTTKIPFHDNAGKVIGLVGIARDITARKLAEEESFHSRQMLQLVVDNIPMMAFWKDSNLVYLGCNRTFAAQVGLSDPLEIVGKTDFDLPWKALAQQHRDDDQNVIQSDTPKLGFKECTTQPDGSQIWSRSNKIPLHDRDGKVMGLLVTSEDITERRLAEQEIEIANEKLISWVNDLEKRNQEAYLMRQMSDLLQVSNEREEYYTIIKEFVPQLFPDTSGALFIISNSRSLVDAVTVWGDDLQSDLSFAPTECWAMRRGQIYQGGSSKPGLNCRHIKNPFSGSYLEVPMMASGEMIGALHIEGRGGDLSLDTFNELAHTLADHLSLSFSNLKLRETLRTQSIRDTLTGLFNRRYMEESLAREIPRAMRKNMPVGIIMLDIDHFKVFNDTNGHDAGDMVLREMGALLKNQVRGEDITCRYGGEEFILILPEATQEITIQRAEQIRKAIKGMRVEYRRQPLGLITISLGVAVYPEHSSTVEGILKKADQALYHAKHNGRDQVGVATID
ncbi:MAG: diguanylate cyclase [Anaerolineaceae bacterium]|nr:diguanylate cyclase [Anaerolineaceae bacterium]